MSRRARKHVNARVVKHGARCTAQLAAWLADSALELDQVDDLLRYAAGRDVSVDTIVLVAIEDRLRGAQ